MNKEVTKLKFAAIDPVIESNIIKPIEEPSNKGYLKWGLSNDYPLYINSLYNNVPTLHSIIDGTLDYIIGDGVEIDDVIFSFAVNTYGDSIEDLFRLLAKDYLRYGGFALNVVKNYRGDISGLYYVDLQYLRTDEHRTKFFFSKEWNKSRYDVTKKFIVYEPFDKAANQPTSIYYYCNNRNGVYPVPVYGASILSCETEKMISEYWLNSLSNGFMASYFVKINSGIPNDEEKEEIEEYFTEKYGGYQNSGRILFSFANDKDHNAEIDKFETDDFGEKYKSLKEHCREEIFTAFRATPSLFGIYTATTGFNSEEYKEAYALYNKTVVSPIQKLIQKKLEYITGKNITVIPFSNNLTQ